MKTGRQTVDDIINIFKSNMDQNKFLVDKIGHLDQEIEDMEQEIKELNTTYQKFRLEKNQAMKQKRLKDTSCGKHHKLEMSDDNASDEEFLNELTKKEEEEKTNKSKMPSYMLTILKARENMFGDDEQPKPMDPDTEIQQRNNQMEKIVNEIESIDKQMHDMDHTEASYKQK